LGGASCSRIAAKEGEQEHASAPLGHTEVLRVENSPRCAIPEVNQGVEDCTHVSATI